MLKDSRGISERIIEDFRNNFSSPIPAEISGKNLLMSFERTPLFLKKILCNWEKSLGFLFLGNYILFYACTLRNSGGF